MVNKSSRRVTGILTVILLMVTAIPSVGAEPWRRSSERRQSWTSELQPRQGPDSDSHHQNNEGRSPPRLRRLSPEERSQLRRDIKDAGREIYPGKGRD
jgi:hypothetical protein